MPSCTVELLNRKWPSSESVLAGSNGSSGYQSPSSPTLLSPISTSPDNTLRRRRIRRASSVGSVIKEPFVIQSDCRDSRSQSPVPLNQPEEQNVLADIIGWYPCFLLKVVKAIMVTIFPQTCRQFLFAIPMFWISLWIWCFWQFVTLPLTICKLILSMILTPASERYRQKKTVLISGGSTIQSLHLARNFYSAGAKVIVCEIDGLFSLARFSTAVSKFYTVPKPTSDQQQNYVRCLCEIVDKENVSYYVPVSATTSAYYDAVAKPHLELLGCTCFCPGIKEVWALDDTLEMLKRCQKMDVATPTYHAITSKDDVLKLYETGAIRNGKYVMSTAGPSGLRERAKMVLPLARNDLKLPNDISEQRPWVIVQDVEGEHFLTCTTIKESKVIANVTCRLDKESNGLVPMESREITNWLNNFFNKLNLLRPVNGHISFRFVMTKETKAIVPLSSRVGISLPYICYTSVHPKLLWRPCKHFSRQNSGPIVSENGRYWMPETVISTLRNPSVESMTRFIGTVLDKREALFTLWDPLPYCAYYHMQIPFQNILDFVQRTQDSFPRTVTAPVH